MVGVKTPSKLGRADRIGVGVRKVMGKGREFTSGIVVCADPEPARILGGCLVVTADGHKQVDMDWQSVTQEHADTLAERLLPLL